MCLRGGATWMLDAVLTRDGIDARLGEFRSRRTAMKDADRYFYLQPTTGPVNHRVRMADGREMVMLASYSYLGLIGHPRIDAAASRAVEQYGTGAGGVRLLTGTNDLHVALESRIARFASRDDACVYSSGYVTNVAIITGLTGPGDLILMDKLDHASIVDGALLSGAKWRTYRHNDMDHLEKLLAQANGHHGTVMVVADSVFSMDGDVMDLPETKALCQRYGARLMVDEAHSIGSLGLTGHGIEEHFDMVGSIDLKMGTLSKSTAAALEAFDVIDDEPWRVAELHRIQDIYAAGLKAQGWNTMDSTTCVVPVLVGDEHLTLELTRMLFDRGVFVCPIVHPAVPRGSDRLRTCLMATHTVEDVEIVLDAFSESGRKLGLI